MLELFADLILALSRKILQLLDWDWSSLYATTAGRLCHRGAVSSLLVESDAQSELNTSFTILPFLLVRYDICRQNHKSQKRQEFDGYWRLERDIVGICLDKTSEAVISEKLRIFPLHKNISVQKNQNYICKNDKCRVVLQYLPTY
jgi:hypothetical protein